MAKPKHSSVSDLNNNGAPIIGKKNGFFLIKLSIFRCQPRRYSSKDFRKWSSNSADFFQLSSHSLSIPTEMYDKMVYLNIHSEFQTTEELQRLFISIRRIFATSSLKMRLVTRMVKFLAKVSTCFILASAHSCKVCIDYTPLSAMTYLPPDWCICFSDEYDCSGYNVCWENLGKF